MHARCTLLIPCNARFLQSGSMGPGEDYDAMDQHDGGDGGAGGGDPDYALHRRPGRGRSGSRGSGQRGRRRGARGAAGLTEDDEDAVAEDDDDLDGDAVAGLTQLANLAAAAQSASPSRDDGHGRRLGHMGGGSDGEGEGRGDDTGGLGGGMSLDQLLAAPALLSPTTAALLAVHRAGLEAADGAGGGAGAGAGLPGDLLQRLAMQAAAVQQQFALAALAHNLAASQRAAATGAVEEEASGGVRGCGDAGGTENGTLSPRSSKRQRTAAAAAALGGEGPNGAETGAGGAGAEQPGWLGSRRLLHTEAEPSVEVAAPGGRSRAAGSWRGGGGDSRQGGPSKRRGQHAGGGSGPAGQEPLDEDSLAGLNGLAVAALELSGMGLAEPGGVLLPPPLELLHVPPALSLEPMGREALQVLGREQLVDRVLLLQAHLQLATQQQQQPQAELRLQAAGSEGAALGAGAGGLPMASPATRLLQALPAGMSPGQKLNAILAQEGLLPGPVAAMASAGPAGLGVPLPLMPQVKQQPLEQQSLLKEQEAAAVRAVGQQTPPRPAEVRSPVRLEQKPAEDRPSSTAAAATTTVDMGVSDAGNAAAAGGAVAGGDDESMGDPAPSDADEAHLQGGGGAPEVASAPTAVVA